MDNFITVLIAFKEDMLFNVGPKLVGETVQWIQQNPSILNSAGMKEMFWFMRFCYSKLWKNVGPKNMSSFTFFRVWYWGVQLYLLHWDIKMYCYSWLHGISKRLTTAETSIGFNCQLWDETESLCSYFGQLCYPQCLKDSFWPVQFIYKSR